MARAYSSVRLAAEAVGCRRGERVLFEGLSFGLGPGEALGVRGANGSGKTTLLRALAGYGKPHTGKIFTGPDDALTEAVEERQQLILYLGHQDGLKPTLTVMETVRFWARLYGTQDDSAAVLERMQLHDRRDLPVRVLSAGQKRRLALSRLLIANRPIWILDEPTVSLDTSSVALVEALIAEHRARGGLGVVALHGDLELPGAMTCRIGDVGGGA